MNTQTLPEFIFNDTNTIEWIPSKFADGVEIKKLGKANGRSLLLVRFQPGASYPSHVHSDCEFIYVLEGSVLQNGKLLTAGCSTVAEAGTVDETFISPSGCTFLLFYSL
jgi:quercetin dioxygenase-like cupin family protein